ncbi:TetR/AcrR family transcriptional regulator [Sulfurirhabdus autotrophica]|nr:TetR/AcrR family transcriptional regulator [Sulfurirhabdus autotrophica]
MGTTRQRLSAEERQEEIVKVAVDLAAERGVDEVTTKDMADAMGLTQGAIFRHFATKDDIWFAVMQWIRARLMKVIGKAADEGVNPLDSLERMFFAHIAFISKHPAIPRLLFSERLHTKSVKLKQLIQEIMAGYEAKIAALLAEAKSQGIVSAELDENGAAVLYIGMIQGLVIQSSIFRGKRSLEEEARKVFPVYKRGISAK